MNRKPFLILIAVIALLVVLVALTPNAGAQSGGTYDLTWSTIDGGGGMFSTGGTFELGGTIGQHDASNALAGGIFSLAGGFWANLQGSSSSSSNNLFLPFIRK